MDVDWTKIKNEYITTKISQRALAKKYSVNANVLMSKANKEKWAKKHKQIQARVQAKAEEKIVEKLAKKQANYIVNIAMLNSKLGVQVERLLDQAKLLSPQFMRDVSTTIKTMKDIQYENETIIENKTQEQMERIFTDEELRKIANSTINEDS